MVIKTEFGEKDDGKVTDQRDECELQVSAGSQGSLYNLFALRRILCFEGIWLVEALKKNNVYLSQADRDTYI